MGKHDPISLEKRITITKDQVKAWAQAAEAEISEAEKNCQFSDALMKSYKEQGFNRLLRPWRHGGPSVRPTAFMELVRTVGYHSSAAAWLFYFYPIHEAWAAYLPQNRQERSSAATGLSSMFSPRSARSRRTAKATACPVSGNSLRACYIPNGSALAGWCRCRTGRSPA
ncbi:hypothetical protein [Aquamicrobium terrae]